MMQDFYIKEIKLQNYRRFEDKTLQLDKQMNLLIGKNASGKTTILEAVNVALGAYLAAYKTYVPSRFVRNIAEADVRKKAQKTGQKDVLISPEIGQYPCAVEALLVMDEAEYPYRRLVEKMGNRTKFAGNNPMQKEVVKWENAMKGGDESDASLVFPLVLYLSSARLWNENKNSDFNYDILNRTDAYHRCLDPKRGMQMPFNYIRHLKEISSQENGNVDFPAYTLIMEAIRKSMEEELKPGQRIDYSLRYNGLALVEEDGTWIPFDDLSMAIGA
ncbi:MAG: ATP-binding protein [Lachnospiraceae bacterium]|nr:ATP-binding protein [Lachnospiraceae bacterium]